MTIISVRSVQLNETTLSQGFHAMFDWNLAWRVKFHGNNAFLMRLPNKAKLV